MDGALVLPVWCHLEVSEQEIQLVHLQELEYVVILIWRVIPFLHMDPVCRVLFNEVHIQKSVIEDARERLMERTDGTEAVDLHLLVDPLLVHDPIDADQPMFPELGDEMVPDGAANPVVGRLFDVWSLERLEPLEGERVEPDWSITKVLFKSFASRFEPKLLRDRSRRRPTSS